MLQKLPIKYTIALFVFTALTPFCSLAYDQEFNKHAFHNYLQSFGPQPPKATRPPLILFETFSDMFKKFFGANSFFAPTLSFCEQLELMYQASGNISYPDQVISSLVVNKIDLISGSGALSSQHLMSRILQYSDNITQQQIDLLKTISGNIYFVKTITQPHTNIEQIVKKQNAIRELTNILDNDKNAATIITRSLETIGAAENRFVSYYDANPFIEDELVKPYYWQVPILTKLNDYTSVFQASALISPLRSLALLLALGKAMKILATEDLCQWTAKKLNLDINASTLLSNFFQGQLGKAATGIKIYVGAMLSIAVIGGIVGGISGLKINKDTENLLQTQLIGVASYVNGAQELYKIISENPELAHNFSGLKALEALVKPSTEHSCEFNELIELLSTNTFKGNASFFSLKGRVLRAHLLMSNESVRREFASIVNAIGEIDVYVALAHKINESANKTAQYSLVTFDTTSKKPYIKSTGIWNPFVPQEKAVVNDIDLGCAQPRNIVLSGPNTGGKSTIVKALLLNFILAQTFGIVAAKSMIMTPFANLDCYMNMADDTANRVSGLRAEALRAKKLIDKIKITKGFSFVLLDEIFTATSPDQAEKLALDFLSKLCSFKNTIFIDAVHFEGLIQFAENSPDCRNCHMGAVLDANGSSVSSYTYKLAEGRSHIKNAAQVAQETFDFEF